MPKSNTHTCELKQDTFGLSKLPPNAPWYRKFGREVRKYVTLNPNSTSSRRFFRNKSTMISEQKRHLRGSLYIIHPFSTFNRIREFLFCFLWILEMILSPIHMSFIHIERCIRKSNEQDLGYGYKVFFLFYMYVVSPVEAFLMFTFFVTGYVNIRSKEIVIQPTKIVKKYLKTYYVTDIFMVLKFGIYSETTRLLYLMNMFCMIRAGTVFNFLRQIVVNCKMREEVYDCIRLFVVTLIMLNTFTCFFYYIPWVTADEDFANNSWVEDANINLKNHVSISTAYIECMLCIVCHFFGAGEGLHKIEPEHFTETLMLVIVMVIGRMWTLYVIACVLKIFSIVTVSESKYEEYLLQLEVFMRQKRLPKTLKNRLLEYYKYKYQNHFFNEQAIFSTLSNYLRQELLLYGARKLIIKVELFRAFPRSVVGAIIGSSKQAVYLPNDVIVKTGDLANEIYFISSGTVALTTDKGEELVHLEDGDEIGLVGAFDAEPYYYLYNYFAIETTELYVISKKDFRSIIFDQGDVLKYFTKKMQDKINVYKSVEKCIKVHGYDFFSELSSGRILERPRLRPTFFEI